MSTRPNRENGDHPRVGAADGSGAMFDAIAPRYDLLNTLMSLGLQGRWRRALVAALASAARGPLLDLATGTADVAVGLARAYPGAPIVGVDPSPAMLERGRQKVASAGLQDRIELQLGDASALPFQDETFRGAGVAFGVRNFPDRPRALSELARVVRPGGWLAVLELSEPSGGPLAPLARLHAHRVVPLLGRLLASRDAYAYLPASIAAFPRPDAFAEELRGAGWSDVRARRLTTGAAHLFTARKA